MSSKRDLFLVRLACRKRWLTAEQGEECLALSRRLGATRNMDEILRLQGYLTTLQIAELGSAADRAGGRRRGVEPRRPVAREDSGEEELTILHTQVDETVLAALPDAPTLYTQRPTVGGHKKLSPSARFHEQGVPADQTRLDVRPVWPELQDPELERLDQGATEDATVAHTVARLPSTRYMPAADFGASTGVREARAPPQMEETRAMAMAEVDLAEARLGLFGNYELEAVLARGTHATVYRARRRADAEPVAVRVLDLEFAEAAQYVADRAEGLVAAAQIQSPRVVRLVDVGHVHGRHYLATELVEGWTLEELLWTDGAPSGIDALTVLDDVAEGLLAAQAVGVAHGAFGPGRILIEPGPRARLFGFGLAINSDMASDARAFLAVAEALLSGAPEPLAGWAARFRTEGHPDLARMRAELGEFRHRPVRWTSSAGSVELPLLMVRSLAGGAAAIAASMVAHRLILPASWTLNSAFLGALGLGTASLLLGVLALIRRGELPLPGSTAWLVRLEETFGLGGAALVAGGLGILPLAGVHLVAGLTGAVCVVSRTFGVLLRRVVALRRPDRGRGRVLAVLADPLLVLWRVGYTPWVLLASSLALTRFALLAYFAAG